MSLDTTNFHPQGPVKSVDLLQFYNLFTGVMTDQPVTFSNTLTLGGNQGVTTVPLRVYGAVGQNTDLIDLYADKNQAQPGFGFSALGKFAWGPGGASPQDTFLSRIALQNGHSSDTPGLFINPSLEVSGNIKAAGYTFNNGGTVTGPTGSPNTIAITTDLTVSGNETVTGNLSSVGGCLYLNNTNNGIRSSDGNNVAVFTPGTLYVRNTADTQFQGILCANIDIRSPGGNTAISWGDGSHYLQYAPAGQTSLLAWTHDFKAQGYLGTGASVIRADNNPLQFLQGTGGALLNIQANDLNCQSISMYQGSNQVIYWRDASHYLQYAPAGATTVLAWTHDFETGGYLKTNGGRIRSAFNPLQFMDSGGGSLANIQANDLNCQSISMLQGSNQVIYWRDGSHYLQYAPAGSLTTLRWTHTLEAGLSVSATGGPVYGLGAYVNTASYRDLKHGIATLNPRLCLEQVEWVPPVSFSYKDPGMPGQRLGFIIEDVEPVIPQAVDDSGLRSEALISVLWGAVRELSAQVRALQGVAA